MNRSDIPIRIVVGISGVVGARRAVRQGAIVAMLIFLVALQTGCQREDRIIAPRGPVASFAIQAGIPVRLEDEPDHLYWSIGRDTTSVGVTIELGDQVVSPMREWLLHINDEELRDIEIRGRAWTEIGGDDPVALLLEGDGFAVFILGTPPMIRRVAESIKLRDQRIQNDDG